MGSLRRRSLTWPVFVSVLLLSLMPQIARGQLTPVRADQIAPLQEFLARGSAYETQEQWQRAADVYERALRHYPDHQPLRDRWLNAERYHSFTRRYQDPSYTGELLALSLPDVQGLYTEVLDKIQTHYVRQPSLTDIVRRGYQNLDLALRQTKFQQANFAALDAVAAESLRTALQAGWPNHVTSVEHAAEHIRWAVEIARRYGLRRESGVVMEFVSAATDGLDPYSTHLSPGRLTDLYSMIDGNFVGLGVEVRGSTRGLEIVKVLPNSPAHEGGLQAGQQIVKVDGQLLVGNAAEHAADLLQGPANSRVTLTLETPAGQLLSRVLVRREVVVDSIVDVRMLSPLEGVGYLRCTSFQKNTDRELVLAVDRLSREGMRALVIDLRGNPGGLLDVSLAMANRFIPTGVLVSTRGRGWGQNWTHQAQPQRTWSFPVAVLIDGNSASASEILAAAFQDHRRGTIVGDRSYGKGSVQSIFPLRTAKTGLRLTTAYFYSPSGRALQNVGVEPDVRVSRGSDAFADPDPIPEQPMLDSDRQLQAAFETLRQHLTPPGAALTARSS